MSSWQLMHGKIPAVRGGYFTGYVCLSREDRERGNKDPTSNKQTTAGSILPMSQTYHK